MVLTAWPRGQSFCSAFFVLDALMRMAEGDDGGSITASCWKARLFHLSLHPGTEGQLAGVGASTVSGSVLS